MKVHELISRLEDLDPDAEVRFAYQESWPLQDEVQGVWTSDAQPTCPNGEEHVLEQRDGERWCVDCQLTYEENELEQPDDDHAGKAFIVSGGQDHQHPYGPRKAFAEAW